MPNDSNYNSLTPLGIFPNWIFCPKIVPLVYDDSLSYYEFLNKLMVKLNEVITFANQINANVEYLREIVERIQTLIDGFDARITANEQDIANLKTAMDSVNTIIEGINSTLTDMQSAIDDNTTAIETLAHDVEEEIESAIVPLQTSVHNLTITVESNTSRITTLEQAAFDPSQIVMTNNPFNFALSMIDASKNGVRIVVDESVTTDNSIQWVDGATWYVTNVPDKQRFLQWHKIPRFFNSGNPCHLVIPSVFPNVYRTGATWTLYFYCHRWGGEWSDNSGLNKVGPITFTEILAEGGKHITATPETGPFNDMELFKNESTGCYDLHIYNGRNGYTYYGDVMFDSMMVLPLDLGNEWEGTTKQKYYNLLNTYLTQTTSNIDGRINNALAPIDSAIDELEGEFSKCLTWGDLRVLDFVPLSGVSIVSNNSKQLTGVLGTKRASLLFIDLQLDVTDLENNSALSIGQLDLYMNSVTGGRSIEVAIEGANNGAFGSMSSNGSLTIKAFGTFGATTRMRITGTIADIHEYVAP